MDGDHMEMTSMDHDMHMTTTASAAMPTGTDMAMGGMDHSAHGGMGSGPGPACKISMLWNWETIDTCFIDESWHVSSNGMFAGCCIGVICLVICLEFLRRVGREYDAYIVRRHNIQQQIQANNNPITTDDDDNNNNNGNNKSSSSSSPAPNPKSTTVTTSSVTAGLFNLSSTGSDGLVRPSLFDQLVRALLHMTQFAVAYFIMLLAMYYNGYFIICIFIGAFLGSFIFAWEPLGPGKEIDACGVTKCCG